MAKIGISPDKVHESLPSMYWLPKLHKTPYKARFIANSSSCSTTFLSKLLTSGLQLIKNGIIKYSEKVSENTGKNVFWSVKNSGEVLQRLSSTNVRVDSISSYDFSTLYTSLPHDLIKQKLILLIQKSFNKSTYMACNTEKAFFTEELQKKYIMLTCDDFCSALVFLLDNIFINFNNCIYRQKIGIPMGTNCAPLIADLFLFCYERDFMLHLSPDSQLDVIEAFNNTSRYLDDILNMNNDFFDRMVHEIYPKELTLTKFRTYTFHIP